MHRITWQTSPLTTGKKKIIKKERNYKVIFKKREHRCWHRRDVLGEGRRICRKNEKIYNSIFTFKENSPIEKRIADFFKRRVICEEKECNRYELIMEECLKTHTLVKIKNGHRPKEHSCKKENEKLKYKTLIETNILGESKYRNENGYEYPNIKSFQNRTSLPEIEIQESQRKRKGNILSPKDKGKKC